MKILVMTVGGSAEPMVKSIRELTPDHIFFICSSGIKSSRIMVEGDDQQNPNILILSDFPKEKTTVFEVDPDDPYSTYEVAKKIISEHHDHTVYADYTPGTKSMSAGLFLAASEFEHCIPVLVKGPRLDLVKVTGDRSRVSRIRQNFALASRYKDQFARFLGEQDYAGARAMIDAISRLGEDKEDRDFLDRATIAMLAFDLWDRFQFKQAYTELEQFCRQYLSKGIPNQTMVLYKVIAGRIWGLVEWMKPEGETSDGKKENVKHPNAVKDPKHIVPLPVYDLIRNAERRARKEQFDDAVARLYRATELFAQFSLRRLGISTSNITNETLARLPEEHRHRLELKRDDKGRLAIGLFESYELLRSVNPNLGRVWEEHKSKIWDVIRHRNLGWLAHGFEPVTRLEYERFREVLTAFITECEEADPDYCKSKIKLNNYPDLPDTSVFME